MEKPEPSDFSRTVIHRIEGREIIFECPNSICFGRAKGLLLKEPGTIAWIDGFERGSVFWDIGANIGVYSLYAHYKRECQVYAFEPSAANYFALNGNIRRNQLDRAIRALPVAIDHRCGFNTMRMRDGEIGSALHVFGRNVDHQGRPFEPAWEQGMLGVTVDGLVEHFGVPAPNHVKVDVDGNELSVLRGATETLKRILSVLVEVDLNDQTEVAEVKALLTDAGLTEKHIEANLPRHGDGARVFNLVFGRHSVP